MATPVKDPNQSRPQISENQNPNHHSAWSPMKKISSSPVTKSAKKPASAQKSLNQMVSPRNKIRERKFIIAKKNPKAKAKAAAAGTSATATATATCKCKDKIEGDRKKCPCIAYQNLRASQEDFFKSRGSVEKAQGGSGQDPEDANDCVRVESEEEQRSPNLGNPEKGLEDKSVMEGKEGGLNGPSDGVDGECESPPIEIGGGTIKRRRDRLLEEARSSIPETGSGQVKHLVEVFEKLRLIQNAKEKKEKEGGGDVEEDCKKGMKWALPGMQQPTATESESSLCSFSPSELFFTSDNFGMDSRVSSSLDSGRGSITSKTSGGGRRSRRNSSESTGTFGGSKWKKKKQQRVTRQQPFKLRTEQRGKSKEEEFLKKVQEMFVEEEKLRIPIAQGLPWTTDEAEYPAKPPVKESTRPLDLKLHSDIRAVERAEFDHYVVEKLSFIEQYRMEKERQQKLEEEEEIKRLRKELVPRAQPMPYFDRPFIPQRSSRNLTIPKEPKFHNHPQHKKIKCMPWNELNMCATNQH
ncbi:hypothetical protein Sjap_015475 [Stephania japonica]|uniref:TPX2 C-terminal domain-containing protein n=1 Tax=Stephania japonica TaxID=461633 RepID=A0AAP0NRE4_9MAGN